MAQTEAQRRAKATYNAKVYDEFKLRVLKGNKEIIQAYCEDKKISVNNLMNQLLYDRLTADGYKLITKENTDSGTDQ